MINHITIFSTQLEVLNLHEKEKEFTDTLDLITNKPVLYVCNVDEGSALNGNDYVNQVKEFYKK
jgi:ribosome-binding ATPase YchF (GTP1/OBG family)